MFKLTEPYLTVVLLVNSGKNNVHCIRHDVNRCLVFLPVFKVGFLWTEGYCWFGIFGILEIWYFIGSLNQYLIHNLIVGSGQCQIHRMHVLCEFIVARMLTVSRLTEDRSSCLCLLNIQGCDRNPSQSSNGAVIFTLVLVLKESIKMYSVKVQHS